MPAQVVSTVENNFTKGLVTEFTGLNFPENAATDTNNCQYTLVGDVIRRQGFDYEVNASFNTIDSTNKAINTYKWNNAGGDGNTQVVVTQIGTNLYFYRSSSATTAVPMSGNLLASVIDMTAFAAGSATAAISECQFTDGNGYLFVYHPNINPFYCTLSGNTVTASIINVRIRDFVGASEVNLPDTTRPSSLTNLHQYNLVNQGWSAAPAWNASSTSFISIAVGGNAVFKDVPAGLPAHVGDAVNINGGIVTSLSGGVFATTNLFWIYGIITAYSGNIMQVTVSSFTGTLSTTGTIQSEQWYIRPGAQANYTSTWFAAAGNYPSNSDVWWRFKDTTGVFNPGTQIGNVTLSSPAPKGSMILDAFNQNFSGVSATPGLGTSVTSLRPKTGTWFQGRVWYAGVDDAQSNVGPASNATYAWTENIYFSQIVTSPTQFGQCYQTNDPTSQTLFDLLPTDGGVIQIQGCGSVYKLFALQNALIIFAANGVWYLTGSQGIGFSANDYTIVKLSSVRSISGTSIVDVQGLPYFWNEEGIYAVEPAKQGTGLLNSPLHVNPLEVIPITVGTIQSFYDNIPTASKKYVRGAYDPIEYRLQWIFKSIPETGVTSRYQYDRILNYNTYNKAFYPYTIGGTVAIHSITYVSSPGSVSAPVSIFKYFVSDTGQRNTFADEHDTRLVDFFSFDSIGVDYTSFFTTGFRLHGQGQKRFQMPYIYVFARTSNAPVSYKIQGLWDYATSGNTGRWSLPQLININAPNFGMVFRRHRIRGQGLVLQIKVSSSSGQPFDIMGWSTFEAVNQGV